MSKLTWLMTKDQIAAGLILEDDEDFVYLKHEGQMIKFWKSTSETTTIACLQQAAHQAYCELKSGVEVGKA